MENPYLKELISNQDVREAVALLLISIVLIIVVTPKKWTLKRPSAIKCSRNILGLKLSWGQVTEGWHHPGRTARSGFP
jgi:hypothetical protein